MEIIYVAQQHDAYIKETHLTSQPVLFDPFGGDATRIDSPDETEKDSSIIHSLETENNEETSVSSVAHGNIKV